MNESDVNLTNTTLSVEAKVFVPSHLASSVPNTVSGSSSSGVTSSKQSQHLNNVPLYMKTCYPFLNNDTAPNSRAAVPMSGPGRPPHNVNRGPPPGLRPRFHGSPSPTLSRGPSPGLSSFDTVPRLNNAQQVHSLQMSGGGGPPFAHAAFSPPPLAMPNGLHVLPPPFSPVDRGLFGLPSPNGVPMLPPYVAPNRPWAPSPVQMISSPRNAFSPDPYMFSVDFNRRHEQPASIWNGISEQKNPDGKKSKKKKSATPATANGAMVSVGTQNDAGLTAATGAGKDKRKAKAHTLICMDVAIQTDFSDEIANLTLVEKPNGLYKKDKTHNWLQQYCHHDVGSTTEEEEVDSDSGYSSPLHRRNLASSGTQPTQGYTVASVTGSAPSGMQAVVGNVGFVPSHHHAVGQMNPYASVGYAFGLPSASPLLSSPYGSMAVSSIPLPPHLTPHAQVSQVRSYAAAAAVAAPASGSAFLPASAVTMHPPGDKSSARSLSKDSGKVPKETSSKAAKAFGKAAKDSGKGSRQGSSEKPSSGSKASTTLASGENSNKPSGTSQAKKKQKKRAGKQRQKSGDEREDEGLLSDEPSNQMVRASSSSSLTAVPTESTSLKRFEDDDFPTLLNAASGLSSAMSASTSLYSEALKSPRASRSATSKNSDSRESSGSRVAADNRDLEASTKESKALRKRRKRLEIANRAAEEELAEISLEQQVLVELSGSKASQSSRKAAEASTASSHGSEVAAAASEPPPQAGKRSQRPINLNIADMITALEKQPEKLHVSKKPETSSHVSKVDTKKSAASSNPLDSSAPVKRGKERENPKPKKPSALKKVILKEREAKKQLRLNDEPASAIEGNVDSMLALSGTVDSSGEGGEGEGGADATEEEACTPTSVNMSPISQTSPISMTPFQASPMNSEVNSPIAAANSMATDKSILAKIHSRRFREYCNQILDKEIDDSCTALLQDLVRFQDRLYQKDPVKAKSKRRFVLGLREVTKHIKLRKIKCVVISPNLERIQSKGGLDEALNNIIHLCQEQGVPFVFALGRKALGRACAKLVPVSCVGVFNYEGSEVNFKRLMLLTETARQSYEEMVKAVAAEMASMPHLTASQQQQLEQYRAGTVSTASVGLPQIYTHLGHSRTPSACSAISFASSILSQPISENYPQSEPETDSRGYEIVSAGGVGGSATAESGAVQEGQSSRSESPTSVVEHGDTTKTKSRNEIDEGHEADTEDFEHRNTKLKRRSIRHDTDRTVTSSAAARLDGAEDQTTERNIGGEQLQCDANLVVNGSVPTTGDGNNSALSAQDVVVSTRLQQEDNNNDAEERGESTKTPSICRDHERIECWVAESRRQMEDLDEGERHGSDGSERLTDDGGMSDEDQRIDNGVADNQLQA